MAEKTLPFLVPVYYKDFECIGNKCEDTCCKNWTTILVDKASYLKMRNLRTTGLSKDFLDKISSITRIKHNVNTHEQEKIDQYAQISFLGDDRVCPMLNEDKLCEIYINLGEEYMCKTCKTFPRKFNIHDKGLEASLICSCPEVVRKVIFNEDGLDFEYASLPEANIKLYSSAMNFSNDENKITYRKYAKDIRNFMIDILQCRFYSMDDRMIILGIFCNKVNSSPLEEIPNIIITYTGLLNMGAFNEHLSRFDTSVSLKAETTTSIIDTFKNTGNGFDIVKKMKEDIADALEMSGGTLDFSKLNPFMESSSYMLENYMVNYIFSEFILFEKFDNLWDVYIAHCLIYSYLKYVLTAMLTKHDELDIQKLTDTFVAVDKVLAHNTATVVSVVNIIRASDANNLPAMITIIKN